MSFHSPKPIFLKTLFSYLTLFGPISFFKYINTKFKGGTLIQNLKGVFAKVKGPGVKLNHKKRVIRSLLILLLNCVYKAGDNETHNAQERRAPYKFT